MDLVKGRERHEELIQRAEEITAVAESESREVSKDEHRAFEDLMAQADQIAQRIAREERILQAKARAERSHEEPTRPELGDKMEYGQPKSFRSFGEQMQAVMRAAVDPRLIDPRLTTRAVQGMSEGSPSDGGFLVQTDFSEELLKRTYTTGVVASRCRRIRMSGNANSIKLNAINETSRADGSRWGGVRAYWTAEAGDKTNATPAFRQIELNLKKLTGLAYVTDELLQDAGALEQVLMAAFTEEMGFKLDDAIINGTGAGMPMGIMASPALVTVAKEAGQDADTVVAENIVKMYAQMYAPSRMNGVWYINQSIEPQLFALSLGVGLGGTALYVPPGGLAASPYGTLLGRPVIAIEQTDTLGDLGDIIFADMSQYILADKGGMQSASSIHVRFVNDESVFRFVYRVDGQPWWQSTLTPFNSAPVQSPFVTLAARA